MRQTCVKSPSEWPVARVESKCPLRSFQWQRTSSAAEQELTRMSDHGTESEQTTVMTLNCRRLTDEWKDTANGSSQGEPISQRSARAFSRVNDGQTLWSDMRLRAAQRHPCLVIKVFWGYACYIQANQARRFFILWGFNYALYFALSSSSSSYLSVIFQRFSWLDCHSN